GIDKAIELATELGEAAGRREIEVGPVVEGWELHGGKRPASAPYRFLLFIKADAALESGAALPAPVRALFDRWKRDGLLQSDAALRPSKGAVRFKTSGGTGRWIDGPFTESKELVAGYSILEVPTLEDAKRFTEEYAGILGDTEVDVREVA
ncbi:MAG TPA: YciI family protein, partial [Kofleriaceae bacterium]